MKRLIPFVLVLFHLFGEAQNTMYFMDRLPQNLSLNPAAMPKMKFFIGLPGISGISANVYNSGFNFNQLDNFIDNLKYENYNPDDFVNSIGEFNLLNVESNINLFSFGFRLKDKGYLSFSSSMNGFMNNRAASDIAYLVADLDNINEDDFPIIIDDISFTANLYSNFGFTYSRVINKHLTLGISPRLNFNMMGLQTSGLSYKISYIEPETEFDSPEYEETLSGKVQLALLSEVNPEAIENGELLMDEPLLPDNWDSEITFGRIVKDKSLTLDIGATYELDKWTFSASILNFGSSVFKTDGIVLNGSNDKILLNNVDKIKIGIPTKIYLGGMHQFSQKWNYALLFNNIFYESGSLASATASLNGYIGSALSTSISYTAGYKFNNLGVGLRLRFFPGTDLYFVTDNIIQAFNYKNAYRFSASAGINISIGVKPVQTVSEIYPDVME